MNWEGATTVVKPPPGKHSEAVPDLSEHDL